MVTLFGKRYSKAELLTRVGEMSQLGEVKAIELVDGRARGIRAAAFKTGSGFNFTVLLDRGLDISSADYCGQSLCWRSATGDVAPAFFDAQGDGWLRSFAGGLLTTCGLSYFGAPDVDQGRTLGLHGRVAHIPACNVSMGGTWEGDDYVLWVHGTVRETAVFQENLVLRRKIWTHLGATRLFIEDTVENAGFAPTEHMMLYHINSGFPVVDEGTRLVAPVRATEARDEEARAAWETCFVCQGPTADFTEQVYYHDLAADERGMVTCGLVNKDFQQGRGVGLYMKYNKAHLPEFIEWKMNGQGVYVMGMEPATNRVEGRSVERQRGTLLSLQPGEARTYSLEIGVLASQDEIAAFEQHIRTML